MYAWVLLSYRRKKMKSPQKNIYGEDKYYYSKNPETRIDSTIPFDLN